MFCAQLNLLKWLNDNVEKSMALNKKLNATIPLETRGMAQNSGLREIHQALIRKLKKEGGQKLGLAFSGFPQERQGRVNSLVLPTLNNFGGL